MSSRRSRSGGSTIGTDVEPIVQVLAELAVFDRVLRASALVAAMTRTSTRIVRLSPTRSNSLLLQHAQQLHLQLRRRAVDFVEEDGAAVRRLEAAGLVLDGPGERPLDVPEEFAFEQVLVQGAAVDADVRAVGAAG